MRVREVETIVHAQEKRSAELESVRQAVTLSVHEKRKIDELTGFYKHLSHMVENVIDKFAVLEKVTNKLVKAQSLPSPLRSGLGPQSAQGAPLASGQATPLRLHQIGVAPATPSALHRELQNSLIAPVRPETPQRKLTPQMQQLDNEAAVDLAASARKSHETVAQREQ